MEQEHLDQIVIQLTSIPNFGLEEVYQLIHRFNTLDPKDIPIKVAREVVSKLAYYHFMLPYGFDSRLRIWRVRKTDGEFKLFTHAADLGYPPKDNIDLKRISYKKEAIFYGASSESTAFAESRLKEKEVFHLTHYGIKDSGYINMGVIGDIDRLRRSGSTFLRNKSCGEAYQYILNNLDENVRWAIYLVDAFFSDWMSRKGEEHYSITSAIAGEFFNHQHCSGLIYPSVLHEGGHNYAIKASCYDEFIFPITARACMSGKHYGYELRRVLQSDPSESIDAEGNIHWPKLVAENIYNEFFKAQPEYVYI